MRAVGYPQPTADSPAGALYDIELPRPEATDHDLVVEVRAVSVNPVDTKVRASPSFVANAGVHRVLGWDAAGVVVAAGPLAARFKPGDEVFYAGALMRAGTNSEFHAVDERLVGRKPASLDFAAAAALPLTSITAWELLFERLRVPTGKRGPRQTLLVIGGAGGVGSMVIQLAARLTNVTVIATASRPESQAWCCSLGAHHVIDHTQSMATQLAGLGLPTVDLIIGCTGTNQHFPTMVEVIAPQGHIALIDDPAAIDIRPLKRKSVALHWELMFTRSLFGTADMVEQHHLLNEVAALIDAGVLRSTQAAALGVINATNLMAAHARLKSGTAIGKLVLAGW